MITSVQHYLKMSGKENSPTEKNGFFNENIPAAYYNGYKQESEICSRSILINYHGTLSDLLNDKSGCEFCEPISGGKSVDILEIKCEEVSNTSPFTFLVKAVGDKDEMSVLNTSTFSSFSHVTEKKLERKEHKVFAYVPAKGSQITLNNETSILFNYNDNKTIRDKILKYDEIRKIKNEVDEYSKTYNLYYSNIRGVPRNSNEYVDKIVDLAHLMDVDKVIQQHGVLKDEPKFECSTKKNKAFYDFLNMTFVKDKLLLNRIWEVDKSEHQKHPINMITQAIELINKIKNTTGGMKYLKLNFIPVIKRKNFRTSKYTIDRERQKPEYHNLLLKLKIKYKEHPEK
jgi:hypothetical protein